MGDCSVVIWATAAFHLHTPTCHDRSHVQTSVKPLSCPSSHPCLPMPPMHNPSHHDIYIYIYICICVSMHIYIYTHIHMFEHELQTLRCFPPLACASNCVMLASPSTCTVNVASWVQGASNIINYLFMFSLFDMLFNLALTNGIHNIGNSWHQQSSITGTININISNIITGIININMYECIHMYTYIYIYMLLLSRFRDHQ